MVPRKPLPQAQVRLNQSNADAGGKRPEMTPKSEDLLIRAHEDRARERGISSPTRSESRCMAAMAAGALAENTLRLDPHTRKKANQQTTKDQTIISLSAIGEAETQTSHRSVLERHHYEAELLAKQRSCEHHWQNSSSRDRPDR